MTEHEGKRPRLQLIERADAEGSGAVGRRSRQQSGAEAVGEAVRALGGADIERGDHEALLALALGDPVADAVVMASEPTPHPGHQPLAELCASLRAAWRAGEQGRADGAGDVELAPGDHQALLAMTLGDEILDGSDDEVARFTATGALAELSSALRAAHASAELDELSNERVLRRALRASPASARQPYGERRSVIPILGAVVALAAGVALLVTSIPGGSRHGASSAGSAALIAPHSTAALFDPGTPFARKGGESERLATIVAARAGDLRANRFAQWGVR